jgi:hypothetical protein
MSERANITVEVKAVRPEAGDVLIVKVPQSMWSDANLFRQLGHAMLDAFPHNEVLFMPEQFEIRVVRGVSPPK